MTPHDPSPRGALTPPLQVIVVSALLLVGLSLVLEPWGTAIGFAPFCLAGPALAWIDLTEHLLPRRLSKAGALAGVISLSVVAVVVDESDRIAAMIAGASVATLLIGMLYVAGRGRGSQGALGLGDVYLAPLLGVHLGWFGSRTVFAGLVLGWLLIGLTALVLLASRRVSRSSDISLGPSLLLGAYIAMIIAA